MTSSLIESCVGAVYSNAKLLALCPTISLLNVSQYADVVLQQFYMGASTHNIDAQWSELMFGGAVVANFKAFDPNVILVMNSQYAASAIRSKTLCVEDGLFSGIASKSNVSIRRVAGCVDGYALFVDSTSHIDGTTRTHSICGMLNGAPRCRLRAGIRIIPGLRHVEGGVGLPKGPGHAHR